MKKSTMGIRILYAMTAALLVLSAFAAWKFSILWEFYGSGNAKGLSLFLNGIIVAIFVLGVIKLVMAFLHYSFEENQIKHFEKSPFDDKERVLRQLSSSSMLYHRYAKIKDLHDHKIPVNHGALSSIMMAEESLFLSFPKYVNNILILTGVFGTIVSLILALVGASTILKTSVAGEGMWVIISGMNTALTTTATAIVCYFFFTFFFHKLTDLQTYIFSQIENIVTLHIVPMFPYEAEEVNFQTARQIESLASVAKGLQEEYGELRRVLTDMSKNQQSLFEGVHGLKEISKIGIIVEQNQEQINSTKELSKKIDTLSDVLKQGFRLPK